MDINITQMMMGKQWVKSWYMYRWARLRVRVHTCTDYMLAYCLGCFFIVLLFLVSWFPYQIQL